MSYEFRGYSIKASTQDALDRYARQHVPLGSFLTAVLENNLMEACGRADSDNLANLPAICAYVYNEMPSTCHGSPAKVKTWLEDAARKAE